MLKLMRSKGLQRWIVLSYISKDDDWLTRFKAANQRAAKKETLDLLFENDIAELQSPDNYQNYALGVYLMELAHHRHHNACLEMRNCALKCTGLW